MSAIAETTDVLAKRVRDYLCQNIGREAPITYQARAKALALAPPNTIHQLTVALEYLIKEDATAGQPLIAALVISKARGGLPAQGFFDCARSVGCFDGDPSGPEIATFYAAEFDRAVEFWRVLANLIKPDDKRDRSPENER